MKSPPENLIHYLKAHFQKEVNILKSVQGGNTKAKGWIFEVGDQRFFLKCANDSQSRSWLAEEYKIYAAIKGSFMPKFVNFDDDGENTFLILEDLSNADWPPPWTSSKIDAVQKGLKQLKEVAPPASLLPVRSKHPDLFGWKRVKENSQDFLSMNLISEESFYHWIDEWIRMEKEALIEGGHLLHLDIRSDNLCFRENQVIFIDWNHACRGNSQLDLAFWLPSLHLEGGPLPWKMASIPIELVALISGYYSAELIQKNPHKPSSVRELQMQSAKICFEWLFYLISNSLKSLSNE